VTTYKIPYMLSEALWQDSPPPRSACHDCLGLVIPRSNDTAPLAENSGLKSNPGASNARKTHHPLFILGTYYLEAIHA
jgi:hypothetical protein